MHSSPQAHERYDDGLVHNHNWATTASCDEMTNLEGTTFVRAFTGSTEEAGAEDRGMTHARDRYDDGLVHNHDWAVTGK